MLADEAEILEEGVCYIGEPDGHLTLMDTHLAHLSRAQVTGCEGGRSTCSLSLWHLTPALAQLASSYQARWTMGLAV